MTTEEALKRAAQEMAAEAQTRITKLEREALELKDRYAQKEAECDTARSAPKRLLNLPVKFGADYVCPRCWILSNGKRSTMRELQTNTRDDIFRCRVCGFELDVPAF